MILVEGRSDDVLLCELCRLCGVAKSFDIKSENGIDQLKKSFKTRLKSTNTLRKLWIMIDADKNPAGVWDSIKYILDHNGGYKINSKMRIPLEGLIIESEDKENIIVGVWIMPDNSNTGMLEDFIIKLIPGTDSLLPIAKENVEKVDSERDLHKGIFKKAHKSKATLHTWLAWHDTPGESIGEAVKKKMFETDNELCIRFMNWLKELNH